MPKRVLALTDTQKQSQCNSLSCLDNQCCKFYPDDNKVKCSKEQVECTILLNPDETLSKTIGVGMTVILYTIIGIPIFVFIVNQLC